VKNKLRLKRGNHLIEITAQKGEEKKLKKEEEKK